jgi:AraC family transcriptional regulator
MSQSSKLAPRFENGKALAIAGSRQHYRPEAMSGIAAQWERFMPRIGNIPGQVGRVAYGACFTGKDGIDYLAGVEVADTSKTPKDLASVHVPAQRYAVFSHQGHVSTLHGTLEAIGGNWQSAWGRKKAETKGAPAFFERYGESFDPKTGKGDIEVWIPVES